MHLDSCKLNEGMDRGSEFEGDEEELENGGGESPEHPNAGEQGQRNGEEHFAAIGAVQEELGLELIPMGGVQVPASSIIAPQTTGQQPLQSGGSDDWCRTRAEGGHGADDWWNASASQQLRIAEAGQTPAITSYLRAD